MTERQPTEPHPLAGTCACDRCGDNDCSVCVAWLAATPEQRLEFLFPETPEQTREWEIAAKWRNDTAKPVPYNPPPDDRL